MKRARLGPFRLAAIGCVVAVLVSACSSSGSPAASGSPKSSGGLEKTNINVASVPIIDEAGLYIAQKEGFFKQQGLNVTITPVAQSILGIPGMLSGKIDVIAGGNYVSFFSGEAKGAYKIRVLVDGSACVHHSFSILALPNSGIKTAADLVGKTVAVNIPNNIQTLMLNRILQSENVDYTKVHYVVVNFPNMAAALKAHRVDAISVVEPFLSQAEQSLGAVEVTDDCTGPVVNMPLGGYFATDQWVKKYPNTARAFQRAMEKGQALADSNRGLVEQVLPTFTKITPKQAALITLDKFSTTLDATRLQRVANLMYTGHVLSKPLNVTPLIFK